MLENRPIVVITIGYIIGIIMGLYCKISIVLLYLIIFLVYSITKKPRKAKFKLISFKRYFRYVKIIVTKKVFIFIVLSSIVSNSITLIKYAEYEKIVNNLSDKKIEVDATVCSNVKNKKYKDVYKIKVVRGVLKNKTIYLNIKKGMKIYLQYGNKIKVKGTFTKPKTRTNFKGFDYKEYLKTLKINGTVEAENIKNMADDKSYSILKIFNDMFLSIKSLFQQNFEKDVSNIALGILFGVTDEIEQDVKEDFSDSNISHILAVSGMHVAYVVLFCKIFFEKGLGKRTSNFLSIIVLLLYMMITAFSPSVVRATIMISLMMFSKIIYKKSDVWTNISLSMLILLIYNPFILKNISLMLSYVGTIGIIIYSKNFTKENKLPETVGVTIAVAIFLAPVMSIYFNQIPILSICISMIVGIIVAPIMFLGFCFIFLGGIIEIFQHFSFSSLGLMEFVKNEIFINLFEFLKYILQLLIKFLLKMANIGGNMTLNKVYVVTPNVVKIFLYYLAIFTILFVTTIYLNNKKQNKVFNKRIRNLISLLKFRFNQNKSKVISVFLIISIIFSVIKIIPKDLRIYFIDVGQGDACLIVTPNNKSILIDGGGSESESFDVGKSVLVPYLLDRGIKRLDYIMASHFDTDHIRRSFNSNGRIKS